MIDAIEALQRLREGNARFAAGNGRIGEALDHRQRAELVEGQEPFAVIYGCSDSRVPVEIIFDQGLGDLFVIRVAGNVVAPSLVGSVEFAAAKFNTRLVVVMGHTRCGAVATTLEELLQPSEQQSRNLHSIVERVRPSVEELLETEHGDHDELLRRAVRANVKVSVQHLRDDSPLLAQLIAEEGLMVVGAEYSLETGQVDFFDIPAG